MRNQRDPLWTYQMTGHKGKRSAAYRGVDEIQEVTHIVLLIEHTGIGQDYESYPRERLSMTNLAVCALT